MKSATRYRVKLVTHWQPKGIKSFWMGRPVQDQQSISSAAFCKGYPARAFRASQGYGTQLSLLTLQHHVLHLHATPLQPSVWMPPACKDCLEIAFDPYYPYARTLEGIQFIIGGGKQNESYVPCSFFATWFT